MTKPRDWRKLRINTWVWAYCIFCRTRSLKAQRELIDCWLPLGFKGHDSYGSIAAAPLPHMLPFLEYAQRNCCSGLHFIDATRDLICNHLCVTAADWEYAVYLLRKYYWNDNGRHNTPRCVGTVGSYDSSNQQQFSFDSQSYEQEGLR